MGRQKYFSGREVTQQEIKEVAETVEMFPNLSRTELADTICEHLEWFTPTGTNKREACLKFLTKLEEWGNVQLPEFAEYERRPDKAVKLSCRTDAPPLLELDMREIEPIRAELVVDKETKGLWNEYMERYHYLGHRRPFGVRGRYFIVSEAGLLGCVLMAGAAKALTCRDKWIGWTKVQRILNQHLLVNNSRFLIFPWVRIKNLASRSLTMVSRRIGDDWLEKRGYRPFLLETFVDPALFRATCYRAANWKYLGMTTGDGLLRQGKTYVTSPKMVFVFPLAKDFRNKLCAG